MERELTLKEKNCIVRNIYKKYQKAQLDILYMQQHYNYYPSIEFKKVSEKKTSYHTKDKDILNQITKQDHLEGFIKIIDEIHKKLTPDTYHFIENEYLNFCDVHWWYAFYSRATYYRLKHKALDELLYYISVFWTDEELVEFLD